MDIVLKGFFLAQKRQGLLHRCDADTRGKMGQRTLSHPCTTPDLPHGRLHCPIRRRPQPCLRPSTHLRPGRQKLRCLHRRMQRTRKRPRIPQHRRPVKLLRPGLLRHHRPQILHAPHDHTQSPFRSYPKSILCRMFTVRSSCAAMRNSHWAHRHRRPRHKTPCPAARESRFFSLAQYFEYLSPASCALLYRNPNLFAGAC